MDLKSQSPLSKSGLGLSFRVVGLGLLLLARSLGLSVKGSTNMLSFAVECSKP